RRREGRTRARREGEDPGACRPPRYRRPRTRLGHMDAIVVEDLRKTYGDVNALNGVSFKVGEGEVFGLLGPNGAGKTRTVKALGALAKRDPGRAEVVMQDVVKDPTGVRRTIGYVPQGSGVDRDATGRENLMLQGRIQRMSGAALKSRVNDLLRLVGIED